MTSNRLFNSRPVGIRITLPTRAMASLLLAISCVSVVPLALQAQRVKAANLNEKEIEEIRESAVFPAERVKIYTRLIEERANVIKSLTGRPRSSQRVLKLDNTLQDFTALMDEMGSNLDQYSDRHSDIRKGLKPLTEVMPRWLSILRTLPGESGFDLARKEAIESGEELSAQAIRLLHEQDEYFATHKDERDQERNDDAAAQPTPKR